MRWFVGDVQGCREELDELLDRIRFDPEADELWCLGDLVNRGPDSLGTLRLWRQVGGKGVLGNHDIKALLVHSGRIRKIMRSLQELFSAPDAEELMNGLRNLPALVHLPSHGDGPCVWAVHAGLHPGWTDLEATAARIEATDHDDNWLLSEEVSFATNVRCCTPEGLRCDHTGPPDQCPSPFQAWPEHYGGDHLIIHGHWATRGFYREGKSMGLDSGCVYGGMLTAWCQDEDRIVQIPSLQRPL